MHNLFIVRSPLQLINAIEAKAHFNTKKNILVILYNIGVNSLQLETMLDKGDWDKVIEFDERKMTKQRKFLYHVRLIREIKAFNYIYVFSGDYGTINRLIIANSNYKKLYLIDDGVLTIHLHSTILNPNKQESISLSKKIKMLRYLLFGLQINIKGSINFFTCYNLTPHSNEEIVKNEYHYLQNKYLNDLEKDKRLFLLGQNFLQTDILDNMTYINYLKRIINYYQTDIIYVPHRTEIISDELKLMFNDSFKLQPSQGPIEMVFLMQKKYPKHIVSFNSSALFTLDKIFPNTTIDSIYIEVDDCKRLKKRMEESYLFFKDTGVNLIHLNN